MMQGNPDMSGIMSTGMSPNMISPDMLNGMSPNMMSSGMMTGMQQNPGSLDMMQSNGIHSTQQSGMMDPTVGMSVYKPKGSGTLLADIVKDDESTKSYERSKSYDRNDQGNNFNPYYNQNYNYNYNHQYPQNGNIGPNGMNRSNMPNRYIDTDSESDYSSIRDLANDVNNSLQALEKIEQTKKRRSNRSDTSNTTTESENENDNEENEENEENDKIILPEYDCETDYLKILTEFLLLLTLYVIMSQPFVVSFAASYIHQLNPTEEDGTISMSGIIIYGVILTIMFMVIRKIVFSRM